jgi:hypothetical protein
MAWEAEALRCSFFMLPNATPDILQTWIRVFGCAPQAYNQNPPGAAPSAAASGIIGEYEATITSQTGKLDLTLSPSSDAFEPKAAPPRIVDVSAGVQTLKAYAEKLILNQSLARIAINLHLTQFVSDEAEARDLFEQESGVTVPSSEASDLVFQYNVRKARAEAGAVLNRIWRLSTATKAIMQLQFVAGSSHAPTVLSDERYAVDLVIDVNTVPVPIVASDKIAATLVALFDEAHLILASGRAALDA